MKTFLEGRTLYMLSKFQGESVYEKIEPEQISWLGAKTFQVDGCTYTCGYRGEKTGYILFWEDNPKWYVRLEAYDFLAGMTL